MQVGGKPRGVALHLIERRQFFRDSMRHEIARQQAGDQMRRDRLIGPLSPSSNKFSAILLHKSQDRRSLNAEYGGELLEEAVVDVAGLLEPDDLVGSADEARVAEQLGELPWSQIRTDSLLSEMAGKICRHKEKAGSKGRYTGVPKHDCRGGNPGLFN